MDEDRGSSFGGRAGQVLRETLGPLAVLDGLLLCISIFGVALLFAGLSLDRAGAVFTQLLMALALARAALNGAAGERGGTLLSTAGGPWSAAAAVTARYLILSSIWIVPLVALTPQANPRLLMPGGGQFTPPSASAIALFFAYLFTSAIVPPIFLVVAVSARSPSDLFTAAAWSRPFRGRIGDLAVVYAISAGAIVMTAVIGLPLVLAAGFLDWKLAVPGGILLLLYGLGMGVELLGRLCGLYAASAGTALAATPGPSGSPGLAEPGPESQWPASAVTSVHASAAPRGAPVPPVAPLRGVAPLPAPAPASGTGVAAAAAAAPGPGPGGRTAVLLDARERVEAAFRRFEHDRAGAVAELEDLRSSYAPSPLVLHGICLLRARNGEASAALAIAQEAVPLCLQRGNVRLVAEIFRELRSQARALGLSRDQVLMVAGSLREAGDLKSAANAYAHVLAEDPLEPRAIKGTLQVADQFLKDPTRVPDAHRLYAWLLERSSGSPLAEFMAAGKLAAERKLQAPAARK